MHDPSPDMFERDDIDFYTAACACGWTGHAHRQLSVAVSEQRDHAFHEGPREVMENARGEA